MNIALKLNILFVASDSDSIRECREQVSRLTIMDYTIL